MWGIKLFYDGACPVCRREVQWLKRHDHGDKLAVEDICDRAFDPGQYGLTREEVTSVLHGVLPDGRVVRGLEAVRQAYQTIGLGWLVALTRWPVVGWACNRLYSAFARHRMLLNKTAEILERRRKRHEIGRQPLPAAMSTTVRAHLGRMFGTGRRRRAAVVADGPPRWKWMLARRKSLPYNWIRDADRPPLLSRKRMVRRRVAKSVSPSRVPRP